MDLLRVKTLIGSTVDSVGIGGDTWGGRGVGCNSSLPRLFKLERRRSPAILGGDDTPERGTVSLVDMTKTLLVNAGHVQLTGGNVAVKTKRRGGSRIRQSTTRRGGLGKDGNWVADVSGRAAGSGARKERRSRRQLNVNRGLGRICISRRGDRLNVRLVDRGWHGDRHDRRLSHGPGTGRGDGVGTLAAVAPVRKLMVMEAASQLSLFQVSGDMLIWHFLETGLKKIHFLGVC